MHIEWYDILRDATAWASWEHARDMKPVGCSTIGYLLVDEEDYVVVAMSGPIDAVDTDTEDYCQSPVAIPKGAIARMCEVVLPDCCTGGGECQES